MKNRKLLFIPALILIIALLAGSALAARGDCSKADSADTAGNYFACGDSLAEKSFPRDIYWAGSQLSFSNCSAEGDGLIAGYSMNITNSDFGGSLRIAGNTISIADTTVESNITAAGNNISIGDNVSAAGVYAFGNIVSFSGEADYLMAAGSTVKVSGTINGDAVIDANKVVFDANTVIKGHLELTCSEEPSYPAGVRDYSYTAGTQESESDAGFGKTFGSVMLNRLYWIIAFAVVALLLCLVATSTLDKSGEMLLAHPVAMPVTGLVTLCAIPVALILLCVMYIGLPSAGLIGGLILLMCLFALPFAGASAARLVFPKMNKVLASVIGVAILTLLRAVPYLGGLIVFASIIYTVGYFVLHCYENIKALKKQPEEAPAEAEEAAAPSIEE